MKILKALVALVGAVATWFATMSPELTGAAVLAAAAVFWLPNSKESEYAKTWVVAFVLGAGVLIPSLADGFQSADVWPVIVTVLTAGGVLLVPGPRTAAFKALRNPPSRYADGLD